jgi:hypothetical protein
MNWDILPDYLIVLKRRVSCGMRRAGTRQERRQGFAPVVKSTLSVKYGGYKMIIADLRTPLAALTLFNKMTTAEFGINQKLI